MAREKLRKVPRHISTATYKGSRKQSNKGHVWDQNLEPYKTKPFHFEPNRTMFAPNPTRFSTILFDSLTFQLDSSPSWAKQMPFVDGTADKDREAAWWCSRYKGAMGQAHT